MTKETENLIQFILEKQAEFQTQQVELQKRQVEFEKNQAEMQKQQAEFQKRQAEFERNLVEMRKQQIEQDTKTKNKIDFLLEHHAEVETNIQALTNAVAALAIQAEQDRAEIRSAISSLVSSVKSIDKRVSKLENPQDN